MFIYINFQKTGIRIETFTNTEKLHNIKNTKNHENWGSVRISNEKELIDILPSLKRSHEIMKKAIEDNINTGWFALTPKDHIEEDEEGVQDINKFI